MTELPGTAWRADPWGHADAVAFGPMPAEWRLAGQVRHVFTHFELYLDVFAGQVPAIAAEGFLRDAAALEAEALPSVMRKAVAVATGRLAW
jgi:A/G-specific adenine glycosylase